MNRWDPRVQKLVKQRTWDAAEHLTPELIKRIIQEAIEEVYPWRCLFDCQSMTGCKPADCPNQVQCARAGVAGREGGDRLIN
jgi:hypothetical protein